MGRGHGLAGALDARAGGGTAAWRLQRRPLPRRAAAQPGLLRTGAREFFNLAFERLGRPRSSPRPTWRLVGLMRRTTAERVRSVVSWEGVCAPERGMRAPRQH